MERWFITVKCECTLKHRFDVTPTLECYEFKESEPKSLSLVDESPFTCDYIYECPILKKQKIVTYTNKDIEVEIDTTR